MIPWWASVTGSIFNWEVQLIFWACILFILVYTALAPWWRTSFGRALVLYDQAIALAILPSLLSRYFGLHLATQEWVAWLDVICFGEVVGVTFSRIRMVIKVNKYEFLRYLSNPVFLKLGIPRLAKFLLHL